MLHPSAMTNTGMIANEIDSRMRYTDEASGESNFPPVYMADDEEDEEIDLEDEDLDEEEDLDLDDEDLDEEDLDDEDEDDEDADEEDKDDE